MYREGGDTGGLLELTKYWRPIVLSKRVNSFMNMPIKTHKKFLRKKVSHILTTGQPYKVFED